MACILLPIVPQNTTMEYRNIEYSRSRWGGSGAPGELFPQVLCKLLLLGKNRRNLRLSLVCGHESWQAFTFYITPPWLYAFLDQNKPTSICTTTTTMLRMRIMTGLKYPKLTDFPIGSSVSYRARILLLLSSESSSRSQTTRTHSEPPIERSNVQRSTFNHLVLVPPTSKNLKPQTSNAKMSKCQTSNTLSTISSHHTTMTAITNHSELNPY